MPQANKLTYKQEHFARKFAKSLNGTQSALEVYDTEDPRTAQAIGSENLSKPIVRERVEEILNDNGLSLEDISQDIAKIKDQQPYKTSWNEKLRAYDMLYKLHNAYPANKSLVGHLNLNKEIASKDIKTLVSEIKELRKLNSKLVIDSDVAE